MQVKQLYAKHVAEVAPPQELEPDVEREYNRQRDYLERTVDQLKAKLRKDVEVHRADNLRILQVRRSGARSGGFRWNF